MTEEKKKVLRIDVQTATVLFVIAIAFSLLFVVNMGLNARLTDIERDNEKLSEELSDLEEMTTWQNLDLIFLNDRHYDSLTDHLNGVENRLIRWIDNNNETSKEILWHIEQILIMLGETEPDDPIFPDDQMDFEWVSDNLTFQLLFYDNYLETDRWSPIFEVENWSYMVQWVISEAQEHSEIFTQNQKDYLLLISINMAYYKETGTWLGD